MKKGFSRRRNKPPMLIFIFVLLCLFLVAVCVIEVMALPVFKEVAGSQAENMVNNAIEDAIMRVLKENNITYSSLVDIEKDSTGRVSTVKADTIKMNELKSDINRAVSEEIAEIDTCQIQIPIGTVIGISAVSGKGPRIKAEATIASNVNLSIDNQFSSAGINQTLHEIIVNISATVYVIMPRARTTEQVETNFCVAQTVIIGTVPDTFADFQNQGKTD